MIAFKQVVACDDVKSSTGIAIPAGTPYYVQVTDEDCKLVITIEEKIFLQEDANTSDNRSRVIWI